MAKFRTLVFLLSVTLLGGCPFSNSSIPLEGQLLTWSRAYGANAQDPAQRSNYQLVETRPTADGGFIGVGTITKPFGDKDLWLLRLDAAGEVLWSRTYGSTGTPSIPGIILSAQETSDGGALVLSRGHLAVTTVTRADASGAVQWTKTYGTFFQQGTTLRAMPDGHFVIAGIDHARINDEDLQSNAWAVKINDDGGVIWQRTVPKSGDRVNIVDAASLADGATVAAQALSSIRTTTTAASSTPGFTACARRATAASWLSARTRRTEAAAESLSSTTRRSASTGPTRSTTTGSRSSTPRRPPARS